LSRATVSWSSSTDSVVWDSHTTFAGSRTVIYPPSGPSPAECAPAPPRRTDDLFVPSCPMSRMSCLGREPLRLVMHLRPSGHVRVDRLEVCAAALLMHSGRRRYARRPRLSPRHLRVLLHEIAPRFSSVADHVLVVHNCLPHRPERRRAGASSTVCTRASNAGTVAAAAWPGRTRSETHSPRMVRAPPHRTAPCDLHHGDNQIKFLGRRSARGTDAAPAEPGATIWPLRVQTDRRPLQAA